MKILCTFLIHLFLLFSVSAQITFTKITDAEPVKKLGDWRSVNWIDYNNDGWLDLFISQGPQGGANNALFKNNKNGTFTTLTNDPIVSDNTPSDGATWGDFDNDGHIDAFVVNWYGVNNLLYKNNGNGSFTQNTTSIVATDGGYSETASWGDYDNDGFLDLYVANSDGNFRNFLYHNERNGTFTKVTTGALVTDAFATRSVNWIDMDGDGDLDLFVTNENNQHENLYRNDGDGSFTKITTGALVTNGGNTMSSSWGDYDNDGDFDVFLANDRNGNALFKNDGRGNFSSVTNTATETGNSFGTQWGDLDNDGDLDLIVTNAFRTSQWKNYVYLNDGLGSFTKVTTGSLVEDLGWNYGVALGDYDKDGDLDIATAGCYTGSDYNRLYRNETQGNKWIQIKLTGRETNKSAIGSKVRVKATINGRSVWQLRDISAQSGYCGQNQLDAHFGLGNATTIDSVAVEWLSGRIDKFANITPNRFYQITEGNTLTTALKEANDTPSVIAAFSVSPNPSKDIVHVLIEMQQQDMVDASLYDLSGKIIKVLVKDTLSIGKHDYLINKTELGLANGTYQLVLTTKNQTLVQKVVIMQ